MLSSRRTDNRSAFRRYPCASRSNRQARRERQHSRSNRTQSRRHQMCRSHYRSRTRGRTKWWHDNCGRNSGRSREDKFTDSRIHPSGTDAQEFFGNGGEKAKKEMIRKCPNYHSVITIMLSWIFPLIRITLFSSQKSDF